MRRWERRETKPAVKRIEAKDAVLNERWVIFDPSIRAGPSKQILQLIVDEIRRNETYAARQSDGLNAREGAIHQRGQSAPC